MVWFIVGTIFRFCFGVLLCQWSGQENKELSVSLMRSPDLYRSGRFTVSYWFVVTYVKDIMEAYKEIRYEERKLFHMQALCRAHRETSIE